MHPIITAALVREHRESLMAQASRARRARSARRDLTNGAPHHRFHLRRRGRVAQPAATGTVELVQPTPVDAAATSTAPAGLAKAS